MDRITRRTALARLSAVPFAPLAARLRAQARPAGLRRIFPGNYHTLLLEPDGALKGWPTGPTQNRSGELGQGHVDVLEKYRLRSIPGLTDVVAVSAGFDHSLALLKDGSIRAWGGNKFGQVGDGTTVDRATPVLVPGIGKAIAIAANAVSVAVLADGRALTWGHNLSRSLGRAWKEDGTPAATPAAVPGIINGRAVSVGNAHVLVLTQAETIVSWGWDAFGQAGQGTANELGVPAGAVKGVTGVHSVTASGNSSYAFLNDGRIVCWGTGRSWISVRGGAADVRGRGNRTPILLNVDGLDNG